MRLREQGALACTTWLITLKLTTSCDSTFSYNFFTFPTIMFSSLGSLEVGFHGRQSGDYIGDSEGSSHINANYHHFYLNILLCDLFFF